ncbi:hypothetical protein LRAMOSA02058 [Lichtheimia ramosa]|uniref:Thioredoxin domain-containing protein n=1 Tax=Lichtheimia ramosa TaxID=688394 RepID=A0A077WM28_9FUNG|nr:hypothetical protein LRAMOSA02058 [Lichtheimia ramosa]
MKAIRATLENFDAVLKNGLESHNPVYVVFFGTEKPETNESWCPDCVVADPLIRKAILTHAPENALLLEAPVGHREDWKGNASHPYRTRFNLSAIPTLFRWTKEGPGAALVEEDCANAQKLEEFIRSSSQ